MQHENKEQEQAQKHFFGQRFVGASLSRIRMPSGFSVKISDWIKEPNNFMVVTGPAGAGKTYFCAAMFAPLINQYGYFRAYNEAGLFRLIRDHISGNSSGDYIAFLHTQIDDRLLILDDIGSAGHTEWREEILMETIDYRYRSNLPTILTSNLSKEEFLEEYGKRITSRIFDKENLIIDMVGLTNYRE